MATITLYKDKVNGVGSLLDDIIRSVDNLDVQLSTLRTTLQGVDSSTCNLQDTVDSISSSSQSEEEKIEALQTLNTSLSEFIETTMNRDNSACDEINRAKEEFYTEYYYLKPECEKSTLEKIGDAIGSAVDWCCEHWKLLVTIVIVAVAIVLLCTGVGSGLGAAILAGACWGAIFGAVIGGVSGGIQSVLHGGSFFAGFENGAFEGAVYGAIGGAIGGAVGYGMGQLIKPASTLLASIGRGAAIGAVSGGVSNVCVTTLQYGVEHGTLKGLTAGELFFSALTGAALGGAIGGVMGGVQFKIRVANVERYGLKVDSSGKVDGKIPLAEWEDIRVRSIHNPDSDTLTLGRYRPTINPDGTPDYTVPGPDSYNVRAGDTTYFDLGTEWNAINAKYGLDPDGVDMFRLFNQPALYDAVNNGQTLRFTHNPTTQPSNCALTWEWNFVSDKLNFTDVIFRGDFWYGIK